MSNLKKEMKKLKKQQERLTELTRLNQATCPHVSKNGKSKLVKFEENGVTKGRCSKCGEVVILDEKYLTQDILDSSTEVVKSALAELRAAHYVGKIKLDDKTLDVIKHFDADVLRDLADTVNELTKIGKKKPKNKDKKNKDKKKNKRQRWS